MCGETIYHKPNCHHKACKVWLRKLAFAERERANGSRKSAPAASDETILTSNCRFEGRGVSRRARDTSAGSRFDRDFISQFIQ
jgi:hypothetical protein